MAQAAIQVQDLQFSYGKKQVLKGVTLEVPQGAIFGFLGRNGAGKSTLVDLIPRFYRPTSGRILIDGVETFCRAAIDLLGN